MDAKVRALIDAADSLLTTVSWADIGNDKAKAINAAISDLLENVDPQPDLAKLDREAREAFSDGRVTIEDMIATAIGGDGYWCSAVAEPDGSLDHDYYYKIRPGTILRPSAKWLAEQRVNGRTVALTGERREPKKGELMVSQSSPIHPFKYIGVHVCDNGASGTERWICKYTQPEKFPAPEGYEHTGKCDDAREMEYWARLHDGGAESCHTSSVANHPCYDYQRWELRKIAPKERRVLCVFTDPEKVAWCDGFYLSVIACHKDLISFEWVCENGEEIKVGRDGLALAVDAMCNCDVYAVFAGGES